MNDKIDINDLEWVAGVADDLDDIVDELKEANKLLKELDDYLEDNNFKKEINFGFIDQSRGLNKIKDNVQIIRRAAKSPVSSYGYTADMSIASLVDLCIDQPFHKKMEKTVARLAKADISNYTAENSGGIVVEEETWEAGASINSPSTRVVKLVTPKRLTINDILSSPFSKAMRKKQYQEYLKLLYPDLSDKGIEAIDTKLLYDMYLKSQLDMADFDYLTQIEEGLNGLRKIGLGLGLATIAIVLSPATAALLGTGATVITVSSTAVNGFLSLVDVISLISGKDINGNELTKGERDSLLASVVIDGAFLAGGIYSKIQLRRVNSVVSKYSIDDFLKEMDELSHSNFSKKIKSEILEIPKGKRPSPEFYMTKEEINKHLSLFDDGSVKIQSKESFENTTKLYGNSIGDPETGTYVLPKNIVDKAIAVSDGNPRFLEKLLGLESGYLGDTPVLLDIKNVSNIRVPSGNEVGAWSGYWIPGGYTAGGIPEAVIDQIKINEYTVTSVFK